MGKLIWHEYARYVSLTASICRSLQPAVALPNIAFVQTVFGLLSLACFTVNSFGTLLVVFYVTRVVYSEQDRYISSMLF